MKIAVPVSNNLLSEHFGRCEGFTLIETDQNEKKIISTEQVVPPTHQPGVYPQWLADMGVTLVIAGGMGIKAIDIFCSKGIDVISGAPVQSPEDLVMSHLRNELCTQSNPCDHDSKGVCSKHSHNPAGD